MTPKELAYHREWRVTHRANSAAAARRWQIKNPEAVRLNARKWRQTWSPEKRVVEAAKKRASAFRRKYGITPEGYDAILAAQEGRCALCPRTAQQEHHNHLNVDHAHKTGRVRGLLCTPCNHALGVFGDSEEGCLRAAAYCHV